MNKNRSYLLIVFYKQNALLLLLVVVSQRTNILQKRARQKDICGREKEMLHLVRDKTISVVCLCL